MRMVVIASLIFSPAAAGAATAQKDLRASGEPIHARSCSGALANQRPGKAAKLHRLDRLPPADTYAAVYYTDGCPRRLIEAQGRQRR
jgi:hypothetical protein